MKDNIPAVAGGICQHHGAAYAEYSTTAYSVARNIYYKAFSNNTLILQQAITITERCCIAVNAATVVMAAVPETALEIERPLGTIRTTQEDHVDTNELRLLHHAAWEVLDPGTYTYFFVNRGGHGKTVAAAWLKIVASDCKG